MNGDALALDTNAGIHVLNTPTPPAWASRFATICIPAPVAGELFFGALNSRHAEPNMARVTRLIDAGRLLGVDIDTTQRYARVRLDLKNRGRPIPENDVWIAAICLQHSVPIASADEHFRWVEGLMVIGPDQW